VEHYPSPYFFLASFTSICRNEGCWVPSPSPLDPWNHRVRVEFLCKIRAAKKLDTKIFETNNLVAVIWFFVDCHCLSHDYASCGVDTRLDVTGVGCGGVWKSGGESEDHVRH
jgi:hypothetical protein